MHLDIALRLEDRTGSSLRIWRALPKSVETLLCDLGSSRSAELRLEPRFHIRRRGYFETDNATPEGERWR